MINKNGHMYLETCRGEKYFRKRNPFASRGKVQVIDQSIAIAHAIKKH